MLQSDGSAHLEDRQQQSQDDNKRNRGHDQEHQRLEQPNEEVELPRCPFFQAFRDLQQYVFQVVALLAHGHHLDDISRKLLACRKGRRQPRQEGTSILVWLLLFVAPLVLVVLGGLGYGGYRLVKSRRALVVDGTGVPASGGATAPVR